MRTIKLTISYDGTGFVGWQVQPSGVSIQGLIEGAIAKMTGEEVRVTGASRTDAGVHAFAQVASFRTKSRIPCPGFVAGLNSILPLGISILDASVAAEDFHARRDAKGKLYLYRILVSHERLPLFQNRCWQVKGGLDLTAMKRAAKYFVGKKDFSSFRAAGSGTPDSVRKIEKIEINSVRHDNKRVFVDVFIEGNGFLRHMVRNIVGTLVDVGSGRLEPQDVKKVLDARDRKKAGVAAPSCGLYLVEVFY